MWFFVEKSLYFLNIFQRSSAQLFLFQCVSNGSIRDFLKTAHFTQAIFMHFSTKNYF